MQSNVEERSQASANAQQGPVLGRSGIVKILLFLAVLAVVLGVFIFRGIRNRVDAAELASKDASQLAAPAVAVIHAKPGSPVDEIVLSGALLPFTNAPIYSRATGYVKQWYANLGDKVKEGAVLAEIEAPEMDLQFTQAQAVLQQLKAAMSQAQANLQQSKANEALAKLTADRYKQLADQQVVAQQDSDQRQAQYQALIANSGALEEAVNVARSNIAAQEANLTVLDQLRSYRTVRAPFDGVVIARNTDIGALVTAGTTVNQVELFRVAAVNKLRVFVSVPELYSREAVPGLMVELSLDQFPNRTFKARLVRNSGAIDPQTRTLLSEFEIENASGELQPGAYANVHLGLKSPGRSLLLPVSAVMYRPEGARVGVIGADGRARLVEVSLGKDYGTTIEIASGITATDQVIESPPDSLTDGMVIKVVEKGE